MKREDKSKIIEELHQRLLQSKVAILTRFVGLNVERMTQLRRELRKASVHYQIVKNTLLRLALQGTDKEVLGDQVGGPMALAWSDADPLAPARVLSKFSKEYPELQILVASAEGKLWGPAQIQSWVNLPNLESLRGKILGFIQTPATQLVRLINTPGTNLAQLFKARSQQ